MPLASFATLPPMPPRPTTPIVFPCASFAGPNAFPSCLPASVCRTAIWKLFAIIIPPNTAISAIDRAPVYPRDVVTSTPDSQNSECWMLDSPAMLKWAHRMFGMRLNRSDGCTAPQNAACAAPSTRSTSSFGRSGIQTSGRSNRLMCVSGKNRAVSARKLRHSGTTSNRSGATALIFSTSCGDASRTNATTTLSSVPGIRLLRGQIWEHQSTPGSPHRESMLAPWPRYQERTASEIY